MKKLTTAIIFAIAAASASAQVTILDMGPNIRTFSGVNGQTVTCMKIGPNMTQCN